MDFVKLSVLKLCALVTLIGCSSPPEQISPTYVSPVQYQSYSCDQLDSEITRINEKVIEVSGLQQKDAGKDAVVTAVGLVLFWPALFFLADDDHSYELARLKGEYDAITSVAVEKKCDVAEKIVEAR